MGILNVLVKQFWQSCFNLEATAYLLPGNRVFKSGSTGLATVF
jgi:hypothetical protein